ncbi:MAG TPA: hydroxymethylpyrimidine/phosphomethylpyrimidine kinase, partial [archaeon]|nr:hydroxymethylpyrimidine/phosphomethylpyrimidine kinase [archaeon]
MYQRFPIPVSITIAGSDSSGGAGIEADLKTFAALNTYGTCAITAVTIQDTQGVYGVHPIPGIDIQRQIEVVLGDAAVKSAKTGMLYTREAVEAVVRTLDKHRVPLVVDPIFRAGSGDLLIKKDAKTVLIKKLIPEALVVTPNIFEAEEISGIKIKNID